MKTCGCGECEFTIKSFLLNVAGTTIGIFIGLLILALFGVHP